MQTTTETLSICCTLCGKSEDEIDLIEIETNSLNYGENFIEFCDLLGDVFNIKIGQGSICSDCQNQVIQFYCFKASVLLNIQNFEWNQRTKIMRKLNTFLEDSDCSEDYAVLRYNQCFIVIAESKREILENIQSLQSQTSVQRLKGDSRIKIQEEQPLTAVEEIQHIANDDIIVEDLDLKTSEVVNEDSLTSDVEEEYDQPTNESKSKGLKPSPAQRKWANDTTKLCYSVEETDDGIVPIWTCLICEKIYRSAQALRLHLLSQHSPEENETTPLTDDLREWIRQENRDCRVIIETVDGNKFEWTCSICKFTCSSSKTFRTHLIQTHIRNNKPVSVELSEKTLNYHQQIESQTILESNKNLWHCQKCELTYNSSKPFKSHLREHVFELTPDDLKSQQKHVSPRPRKTKLVKFQWTCNECWFQFTTQRSYDAHMKLHETLTIVNPFTAIHYCGECNMFFRNPDDLVIHSNGHIEDQLVIVPADGIALQKTILFKRLTSYPVEQVGSSICGHCGKKVDGEINCKNHLLINHVNPLVCPRDDRKFNAMQPYLSHLQKAHADMFPHMQTCTYCKLSFDNLYERLAHMKICNQKRFSCDHCDRKFSNKNYLNSHLKRELGLLSCSCKVCGKIFKAKDELKIHMRTHTKEKPYKCSICEKSYTTTSARSSHMETHKDTLIQCEICAVRFVARRHYIVHFKRYHDESYRQRKFDEQTCKFCHKQFLRKDRFSQHMLKAHQVVN